MMNTTAPADAAPYVDYLLLAHANGYSLHPAMVTVRKMTGDDGPLLLDINLKLNRALAAKATGWDANHGYSIHNPLTDGFVSPRS